MTIEGNTILQAGSCILSTDSLLDSIQLLAKQQGNRVHKLPCEAYYGLSLSVLWYYTRGDTIMVRQLAGGFVAQSAIVDSGSGRGSASVLVAL